MAIHGQAASVKYQTRTSPSGMPPPTVPITVPAATTPPTTTAALSACDTNSPRENPRSCSAVQIERPR